MNVNVRKMRAAATGLVVGVLAAASAAAGAAALPDATDQPEPLITVGDWVDGEIECDVVTVEQTREVTITPYVFDDQLGEWVLDDANSVTEFQVGVRELTLPEIVPCALPPRPPDLVVPGDWVDAEIECDATTVEQTRIVTTTPYVLGDGIWILDVDAATSETESQTRDLTADEITPCPEITTTTVTPINSPATGQTITTVTLTPAVAPAPEPPPIVLPDSGPAPQAAVPTHAGELPSTGSATSLLAGLALLLIGAGASMWAVTRRGGTVS